MLVDDHELVRRGVGRLLRDEAGFAVVGEAESGEEALRQLKEVMPDVILMDIQMPGMGGIEATRKVLRLYPKIRVVALSSIDVGMIPTQMLQAGASAFITKSVRLAELIKAIRMVHQGQRYLTQNVATRIALDPFNTKDKTLFEKLSSRELQIALMLTDGNKVSEISAALCLSPKTVYSYRYRIFEKLGIRSDVELTILAVQHGLSEASASLLDYHKPASA
ncbi:MAG: response regulator [Pseudohongiellaceae bacterium]